MWSVYFIFGMWYAAYKVEEHLLFPGKFKDHLRPREVKSEDLVNTDVKKMNFFVGMWMHHIELKYLSEEVKGHLKSTVVNV